MSFDPANAPALSARDTFALDLRTPEFQRAQTEISRGRSVFPADAVLELVEIHEARLAGVDEELLRAASLCSAVLAILNDPYGRGLGRKEAARYWRVLQAPPGPYVVRHPLPELPSSQLAPALGYSRAEVEPETSSAAALRRVLASGAAEIPTAAVVALLVEHEALETRAFGLAVNSIDVTEFATRVLEGATRRGWSRQETEGVRENWTSFLETWYEHLEAAYRRSSKSAP